MSGEPSILLAQGVPGAIADGSGLEILRVMVSSLARGGAERIVMDWLAAESRRGRGVELAVLHRRRHEYHVPPGIVVLRRGGETVETFVGGT